MADPTPVLEDPPPTVEDPPPTTDENTVTIPDLGGGDLADTIANKATAVQTALDSDYTTTANTLPAYVAPTDAELDTIDAASTYRTPEDTVAWQMNKLLSEDSPYLHNAEVMATEQANKYGALGSSMHSRANFRGAVESAMPMARDDAAMAGKFGLETQRAEDQIGSMEAETQLASNLTEQKTKLDQSTQRLNNAANLAAKTLDLEGQALITELQGQWTMVNNDASLRLDASLKSDLNTQAINAEAAAAAKQAATDLILNNQVSTEELLKDTDFLQLGPDVIRNTLNNMVAQTVTSVEFIASSTGVDMSAALDAFATDAQWTADVGSDSNLYDADGNLINTNGDLIDEDGNLVDEDGNLI